MAVTPGSASKVNVLAGISRIMSITETERLGTYKNRVLDKGILLVNDKDEIFLTNGADALGKLAPRVDQLLIGREKQALLKTFSADDGTYKATEGGFLMLLENGQMDEASLPKDFMVDGKVNIEKLPDAVRAKISYFANIKARDAANDEQKKGLAFVIDATDDKTVTAGAAMYAWTDIEDPNSTTDPKGTIKGWLKIAEVESLDLDVDAIKASYENVQAAGAVMYDHTVVLTAPTMADYAALLDANSTESSDDGSSSSDGSGNGGTDGTESTPESGTSSKG